MTWPDYFPPDCPPDDSEEAVRHLFRLINKDKEISESFRCHKLLFPKKNFPDQCMACGLSVSVSEKEAEDMRKRVPYLRKKVLMVSVFEESIGLIKHTPLKQKEEHYTWWCPEDVECPWDYFVYIEDY